MLKRETILLYSLFSFGLYGFLGIRDYALLRKKKGIIKFCSFLLFCIAIIFDFYSVLYLQVNNTGNTYYIAVFTFILGLVFILLEVYDIINLIKVQNHPVIDQWKIGQQIQYIILWISWISYLGVPWFIAGKKILGLIRLFITIMAVYNYFINSLVSFILFILGILIDICFGIIPIFYSRFSIKGIYIQDLNQEREFITNKKFISNKNKWLTLFLLLFLGKWGIHDFYTNRYLQGFIKVMLSFLILACNKIHELTVDISSHFNFYITASFFLTVVLWIAIFYDKVNLFLCQYKQSNKYVLFFS